MRICFKQASPCFATSSWDVDEYLERVGVSSSVLNPVSYGEDRPAVNGAGRQPKNRRVEFEAR